METGARHEAAREGVAVVLAAPIVNIASRIVIHTYNVTYVNRTLVNYLHT